MKLLVTIVLLAIAGATLCLNLWAYWKNSRYYTSDFMGASINFHAGNFIVGVLASLGIVLHPSWSWWIGLVVLGVCWFGSLPLMWVVHFVLRPFRQPPPEIIGKRRTHPYRNINNG